MRRIAMGIMLMAGIVACNTSNWPPSARHAALRPLESCTDLEASLKRAAMAQMKKNLDQNLKFALEWGGCGYRTWDEFALDGNDIPPTPTNDTDQSQEQASQYSTTNTQEQGVDEADFIKNDGQTIYLLADQEFLIFQAWPPPETHQLSSFALEGKPHRMFVRGDQAVIYTELIDQNPEPSPCYADFRSSLDSYWPCIPPSKLKITVLDITDKTQPKIEREIVLDGTYLSSRRIAAAVHTAITFPKDLLSGLRFWPEELYQGDCNFSELKIRLAFINLQAENERLIKKTELADMLPSISDTRYGPDGAKTSTSLLEGCLHFYEPVLPSGQGFLSVLSLNLDKPDHINLTSIVGQQGKVYASADALYVATTYMDFPNDLWLLSDSTNAAEATTIHKFSLDNQAGAAFYQASGVVPGRVLNQFSMGEHKGHLRLATTSGWVRNPETHNSVFVLEQQAEELVTIGSVTGIAPTEDIRSARFVGERGFVVTFKKTDPLFTVDLSDPYHPVLAGELKIPGFSTYIHMMDQDHLLTIGFDADDQGEFAWFQGIQLQIFDVSDMSQPTRTHLITLGTRGTSSEASANHLAFNYFAPKDLLALPMAICEGGSGGQYGDQLTFSGLIVWDVTVEQGFFERGRVEHPLPANTSNSCYTWWTHPNSRVKRSVIMDEYVFSISDNLLKVNHLDDLATDLKVIELPHQGT